MTPLMRTGAAVAFLLLHAQGAAAQDTANRTATRPGLALPDVSMPVLADPVPAAPKSTGGRPQPHRREALLPCPGQGPGFMQLPGSGTCIRVSGRVAAGVDIGPQRTAPVAAGQLSIDSRTESDYGPVRTFVRLGHGRP